MTIKIEDITKEHIKYALDYIIKYGYITEDGFSYFFYRPYTRAVRRRQKIVAIRDVVRVAFLHATNRLPPNGGKVGLHDRLIANIFFEKQARRNAPAILHRLGFTVIWPKTR